MSLNTIAKTVLFKILDVVLPMLLDMLLDSEDAIEEYAKSKAEKFRERLTIEEAKNEANDFKKLLQKWF